MATRFKHAQISAVAKLIEHGWSVSKVAAEIHGRYGYANKRTCSRALHRGLRMYGFTERGGGKCSGCGLSADTLTANCKTCKTRHLMRASRDRERCPRLCSGCGTDVNNFTEGCEQCWGRRKSRQRRKSALPS